MGTSYTKTFSETMQCKVAGCKRIFHPDPNDSRSAGSAFSAHLQYEHKVKAEAYTIEHLYAGSRPTCAATECKNETRYVSYAFKKYCKDHAVLAMREAGQVGGLAPSSIKGQTKQTSEIVARMSARMTGENNHFYGKHHSEESRAKISSSKTLTKPQVEARVDSRNAEWEFTTPVGDYRSRQNQYLEFRCKACANVSSMTLQSFERGSICKTCFPLASKPQLEIVEFIRLLGFSDVEISTRKIITPLELDVWVPSRKFAVEYHGLYWHSGGKSDTFDKGRHRAKQQACLEKGIRLVQFFSDEWINKNDICKSMLRNALCANVLKLNARDCSVVMLNVEQSKQFVDLNHISGATRSTMHFGLVHKLYGLIGAATTRTPIQKKHGNVCELARMCFQANTTVRGGASKLLLNVENYARSTGFVGILSYADLRYGTGSVYEKCGFTLKGEALGNYYYTDGANRFDRFRFRAQDGKSEKQVAEEASVRPVWGSGNAVYVKQFEATPLIG